MRDLVLKMSVSLDGFVSGPNGEADWIFRSRGDDSTEWIVARLRAAGLHAMGSRTFRDMAAHWPTSNAPLAAPMNEIPKVVFTRQASFGPGAGSLANAPLAAADWAAARVASGDLADDVRRLKSEPGGPILAHGGASFAYSLTRLGLVDEYCLLVHPVVLGAGRPLFSERTAPLELTLVDERRFRSGAVALVYRPAT